MNIKKLLTSTVLASAVTLTGTLGGAIGTHDAHAADSSSTAKWKDPNTDKSYKVYNADSQQTAKKKVQGQAVKIVKDSTKLNKYEKYDGFATFSYKKDGKWVIEVADSQKAEFEHQQKYGKKVTKKIFYWFHGKKHHFTLTFHKKFD